MVHGPAPKGLGKHTKTDRCPNVKPDLALEDEGHLHIDLILNDLVILEPDPLVLDPGRSHAPQGLSGSLEALADRVLEALRRGCRYLSHARDGHNFPAPDPRLPGSGLGRVDQQQRNLPPGPPDA